jgi:hypothetical protein
LQNTDFDTGRMTHAGEYRLTDNSYGHLLDELAHDNFAQITPELRENILAFYSDPNAPLFTKRDASAWTRIQDELKKLKAVLPENSPRLHISEIPYDEPSTTSEN